MGKVSVDRKEFLLDCFLILAGLQVARMIIKKIFLSVLTFSEININMANILAIIIIGASLFLFLKGNSLFNPAGYRLAVLSNRYDNKKIRIILGVISILSIVYAVAIKSDRLVNNLVIICLASLVIPVYEEFLFREYLWNYLNRFIDNEKLTWGIISVLAAIFMFGYWDIVSQNLEVTSSYKYTIDVMFFNLRVLILTCLASGFMKYKYKDIYLCIFAHIIINSIFL